MIAKKHNRIAIIPARSGSKGLKDKNIMMLCGRPLLSYSVEAAIQSKEFDVVFVSTDSKEYATIAERYGADCHFLRSEGCSSDNAGSWDVVREVLHNFADEGCAFDEVMLLQPTSPLRTSEDISRAISLMKSRNAMAVESLTEMDHSPLWSNTLPADGRMDDFFNEFSCFQRQDLPVYYRENGAIYLIKAKLLEKKDSEMFRHNCYGYVMPRERSVDIDTKFDFKIAEMFMKEMK